MNGCEKLLAERKIDVDALRGGHGAGLPNKGYDPAYGARPLKRVIQKNVQDPLAEEILAGRVKDGDEVQVDVKGGNFVFNGVVPELRKTSAPADAATLH